VVGDSGISTLPRRQSRVQGGVCTPYSVNDTPQSERVRVVEAFRRASFGLCSHSGPSSCPANRPDGRERVAYGVDESSLPTTHTVSHHASHHSASKLGGLGQHFQTRESSSCEASSLATFAKASILEVAAVPGRGWGIGAESSV